LATALACFLWLFSRQLTARGTLLIALSPFVLLQIVKDRDYFAVVRGIV
jgi:hypothetical protein